MDLAVLIIPLITMLAPILIVSTVMRYRSRQIQARYNLLLQLADKGVVLPEPLLIEPRVVYCERRRALTLIGGGIGLISMFLAMPFRMADGSSVGQLWGLGLLPLMVGLGYLASWWLNNRGPMRG